MHADAVVCAGVVVLVVGSREGQLRHGLAQLDRLLDRHGIAPQRVRIAINAVGAPGSPSRPAIEDALTEPLAQRGLTVDAWLPFDRRALVRARRLGIPLAPARHRGPYARALAKLAGELFLPDRPAPQARKQRLPAPAAAEHDDREVTLPWRT